MVNFQNETTKTTETKKSREHGKKYLKPFIDLLGTKGPIMFLLLTYTCPSRLERKSLCLISAF